MPPLQQDSVVCIHQCRVRDTSPRSRMTVITVDLKTQNRKRAGGNEATWSDAAVKRVTPGWFYRRGQMPSDGFAESIKVRASEYSFSHGPTVVRTCCLQCFLFLFLFLFFSCNFHETSSCLPYSMNLGNY